MSVGQICLRKDQLTLAKSVCELLQRRNDVYLAIAGERHSTKAESVAFEAAIRQEFEIAGKRSHLRLLGRRSDVDVLMNAADLLVHAAKQEPFGRTLLEAAASGLPIVATNVGGTAEMLVHGRDAVLVPANDTVALTIAVADLLDDPERQNRLATAARSRVSQQFSLSTAAGHLADCWDGLACSRTFTD